MVKKIIQGKPVGPWSIFQGSAGNEVLAELQEKFHVFNTHNGCAFKEGERSVVLYIMSRIKQLNEDLAKTKKGSK